MDGEKPESPAEAKTSPPLLRAAVKAARATAIDAGVFSLFANLLVLAGPIYMMQIYDRVLTSRSYETLAVITLMTIVLLAGMGALDFARGALLARSARAFEDRLKRAVFESALDRARAAGDQTAQALRDVRQIRQFVASPAVVAIFDAPWTPFYLLIVFAMHWLLGVVALLGLVVLVAIAAINERAARESTKGATAAASEADRLASATLRNAASVDAMGMRGAMRRRWEKQGDAAANEATRSTDIVGGFSAASKAFRLLLQSLILGAGAFLAIGGELSPGAMIAASIIAGRAFAPIEIVTQQWKNFAQAGEAWRRLHSFLSAIGPQKRRTALPAPLGAMKVERVSCQPAGAAKPVVKDVAFALAAGEALGIIGPSAAGKSTLARAIVGVEPCVSGAVRIDGADVVQWERDEIGRYVGYLPQDVELFAGTAAENIARFADDARSEDVVAAAQAAGAHVMILQFPDGYETQIGDGGRHLSAGQRQRVGLARALYGAPVLVVLDEPNSNLDADGEAALAQALLVLKARKATTIVVAHRPSAIAHVDKLLLLVEGEVRAFGPRDEVLSQIAPKQVRQAEIRRLEEVASA